MNWAGWIGVLVGAGALVFAILAWLSSRKSVRISEEQLRLAREQAEMRPDLVIREDEEGALVLTEEPPPWLPAIEGGGRLRLHVREWGDPQGAAIFLIHGWSQNHLSWKHQFESSLANEFRLVALDNRGHGMSEKPLEAEHYTDEQLWADDVAAVIESLRLDRPVLVGWSYGFIISDYVRAHGEDSISGINYVDAAVMITETFDNIGPSFLENAPEASTEDLPTNIAAIRRFLRACTAEPMGAEDWENALCYNMVVPPQVRGALVSRRIDSDDVLSRMTLPVLMTHGTEDTVVLPSMGQHILDVCPTAEASWYEGIGHAPFLEDPERFNREIADFTRRVNE